MSKKKGTRAERELFHMLWKDFGPCVRVAGSGSTPRPAPDLLAGAGGERVLAIECKSVKGDRRYFDYGEVMQLKLFSRQFGAEPWLAIRFDNRGWFFIHADNVAKSQGQSFCVSHSHAIKEGLTFEELLGKYRQKRL
jgi:Holliday junction resolvase